MSADDLAQHSSGTLRRAPARLSAMRRLCA